MERRLDTALYIVATPIGNLGDISLRALEVLRGVDLIAAEDTRHSRQLLAHHGVSTPLTAYHEHSSAEVTARLCARLREGSAIALVSDAGTPLVSDPGYRLVRAAQDAGVRVVPVPGACAAVAALSASGLPCDQFLFVGFLPARAAARESRLAQLATQTATLVFYEAPHRLRATLAALREVLGGEREAALARELSKAFETVRRGTLAQLCTWVDEDPDQSRGEIVLLVAGAHDTPTAPLDAALLDLLAVMAECMPAKQAAGLLSQYTGIGKNALYAALLEHRRGR